MCRFTYFYMNLVRFKVFKWFCISEWREQHIWHWSGRERLLLNRREATAEPEIFYEGGLIKQRQ
jgi:hypothetical protein